MASDRATFREALRSWQEYKATGNESYVRFDPKMYTNIHQMADRTGVPHCAMCGFPPMDRGWVRFDFPVGHPYFGQVFPCPRCSGRDPF